MLKAIQGVYRDGTVTLNEPPPCEDASNVIVVFSEQTPASAGLLASKGIAPERAADLRHRLRAFEDDWNAPGMEAYDEL